MAVCNLIFPLDFHFSCLRGNCEDAKCTRGFEELSLVTEATQECTRELYK